MNMVFHPVDAVQVAFFLLQKPPDVIEQLLPIFLDQNSFPVFGAKYDVVQNLSVGTDA